ncbi:MAG TPA: tetratricopeptide repeat protein [Allosphingosinicella sp.]|nr:tetratricopeptide repeat protein [Allosphingosinicella sp.]
MTIRKIVLLAALAAAMPATASVTILGTSAARRCYEAAESDLAKDRHSLDQCDLALQSEPLTDYEVVATHVNRGILRMRRGEMELALADFDTAIARDPKEAEAYLNKAVALMRVPGGAGKALPMFSAAIEHDTTKPALAYFGRALAHETLGDLKSAYLDYKKANAADPAWDRPLAELARFTVKRP